VLLTLLWHGPLLLLLLLASRLPWVGQPPL
jgi:hypothetical protein